MRFWSYTLDLWCQILHLWDFDLRLWIFDIKFFTSKTQNQKLSSEHRRSKTWYQYLIGEEFDIKDPKSKIKIPQVNPEASSEPTFMPRLSHVPWHRQSMTASRKNNHLQSAEVKMYDLEVSCCLEVIGTWPQQRPATVWGKGGQFHDMNAYNPFSLAITTDDQAPNIMHKAPDSLHLMRLCFINMFDLIEAYQLLPP